MNTKPRLNIDNPLIQAAFTGIYKSGKRLFFRVNPEGHHQKIAVIHALDDIAITYENKMELIASFSFPLLDYSSERMKMKAAAVVNRKPKAIRTASEFAGVAAAADEEEAEEELEDMPAAKNDKANKHLYIIEQGKYFGVYNAMEATVDLYKTRAEAQEHLQEILHGRDGYRISYTGMGNRSRSREAADIHY
jgi:hypothetical protein